MRRENANAHFDVRQLSWNYNYRGASTALTGSPETFCENPDLVATEEKYAWGAGEL